MIKSSRNQCGNAKNPYQGKTKKVLCVCSAGLLRSPTTAKYLTTKYGYNTRACGVSEEYALVPISTALILWSDEIVFAEEEHYQEVKGYLGECGYEGRLTILNIPDMYSYDAPEIHMFLDEKYKGGG
jgi:predicted protein tyrosine phosphatase